MAKKIKYKKYQYQILPNKVKIFWKDGYSETLEFYQLKNNKVIEYLKANINKMAKKEIIKLVTPTTQEIEGFLDELLELEKKQQKVTKEWNQKVKNAKPKLKVGDHVIYNLSYAKVLFKVESIGYSSGPFYNLKGIKILSDDGTNPYKMEARHYNPFCAFFDDPKIKNPPKIVNEKKLANLLKEGQSI